MRSDSASHSNLTACLLPNERPADYGASWTPFPRNVSEGVLRLLDKNVASEISLTY